MTGPIAIRHKPTINHYIQFTLANRPELETWLATELRPYQFGFSPRGTQMWIETRQGDHRDCNIGDCIIRRKRPGRAVQFYPVEAAVIADDYERVLPSHRRRVFGRRPR